MPALYETVTLKSSKNCRVTLNMLLHRKDICGYIRKLAVRPNYYLAWPKPDEHLSEAWVVETIEHLSTSLTAMHTFDWDGLELPNDSLWVTLRSKCVSHPSAPPRPLTPSSCPELKSVFSNVGTRPLDPESSLFDFSDLTSFSLIVRHGLGGSGVWLRALQLHRNTDCSRTFPGAGAHTRAVLGHAHQPMSRPARTCHMQLLLVSACV